jgi:maleylacetate reductase
VSPSPLGASFRYEAKPARVIFGAGSIGEIGQAVREIGGRRAFVLSTAGQQSLADDVVRRLGPLAAGRFAGAVMHTPVAVTDEAMVAIREARADCIVTVGGGSSIGLGKAIALRNDLPQVAVPTTYAGSEMTDILGETRDGAKTTLRSPKVLPELVIYDVELTLALPIGVSMTSGLNALAHSVEALYAMDGNPVVSLLAEEGIRALSTALPAIRSMPRDLAARTRAQYGAWLCGACLGAVSMALHHKLCHVLGGKFNLPHAETHAVMLPHTVAYNAGAAPEAMERIARALGAADAVAGIHDLKRRLVGAMSLSDFGMPIDGIAEAARAAVANPYPNPRPLDFEGLRRLIADAYEGLPPR